MNNWPNLFQYGSVERRSDFGKKKPAFEMQKKKRSPEEEAKIQKLRERALSVLGENPFETMKNLPVPAEFTRTPRVVKVEEEKPKPRENRPPSPGTVERYIRMTDWIKKEEREKEFRPNFSAWEYHVCSHFLPERKFECEPTDGLTPEHKALKEYLDVVRDTRGYGLTTEPPFWALRHLDEYPPEENCILCPLDIVDQDPNHLKRMEDQVVAKVPGVVKSCSLLNLVGFGWGFNTRLAKYSLHLQREDHEEEEQVAEAVFTFLSLVQLKIVGGETLLLKDPVPFSSPPTSSVLAIPSPLYLATY